METRGLLRYLGLGVALMLMFFGAARMRSGEVVREPEPVTAASTQETKASTEPEETAGETAALPEPVGLEAHVDGEKLDGEHVFVYDTGRGELVYCTADPGDMLYPASITKLFTAWVALQMLPEDLEVTAGWELGLLQPGSSAACIALDSHLTVEMLLEGMLLPSGNDAALVLAAAAGRQLAGKQKVTAQEAVALFVEEMNRAAEALDFRNSHFVNPDGYHHPDHYSCPEDLSRIAELALDEPVLRRCMGLRQDRVTFPSGETHVWKNTNRLLNPESDCYCPEAVGMKTGYTQKAGYCLMAAFGSEEPLVVGVFGGSNPVSRYEDAVMLYRTWESLS